MESYSPNQDSFTCIKAVSLEMVEETRVPQKTNSPQEILVVNWSRMLTKGSQHPGVRMLHFSKS